MDDTPGPEQKADIAGQVSLAYLAVLEKLGPEERAAFLLKDVFDYDYPQIAELLGHTEANCRQMVSRARTRVQADRARFTVEPDMHRHMLERFMHAMQHGDRDAIVALLRADARMVADGGGKATAVARPLESAQRIADLFWAVARRTDGLADLRLGHINGEPALLRFDNGALHSIITVSLDGEGRIDQVLSVLNPDKLRALH
jgi:RNA polymerase sigma-70 factor (ECF subfamily)